MKRWKIVLLSAMCLLLISGCATVYKFGKSFNKSNIEKIAVGYTTKDDVLNLFGQPLREGLINGKVVFTYSYEEVTFDENDNVTKTGNTLVIEFDENNIVKNYYLNIPGKEPVILGYMIHKREKEKEQQAAQQNQMHMQPQLTPPTFNF